MENGGNFPAINTLNSGDLVDKLDLTLRLGLPFQDIQTQDIATKSLSMDGSNNVRTTNEPKRCRDCGNDTTPLWRKGPDGPRTLCNACGLRHARVMRRFTK